MTKQNMISDEAVKRQSALTKNLSAKIALLGLILIFANVVFGRLYFRWDLTENDQYSLSPATEKILSELTDVVNVEAYFSVNVPERVQNIRNQLRDLLEEFRARSGGMLQFKFVDPGDDSTMKQKLNMRGIPEVSLNVFDKDRASVMKAYMGISILYQDKNPESIPVVDRVENLEYQIVSAVKKLTSDVVKVVGYTDAKGEKDLGGDLQQLTEQIKEQYTVKRVDLAEPVPSDVATLLILGPKEQYDEKAVYYLDQFVMRGGQIFFAIDQVILDMEGRQGLMGLQIDSGLDAFMNHLGVRIEKNLVQDLLCAQAPFRTQFGTLIQPYPLWPKLADFNSEVGMVNQIDSLVLQWASSLQSTNQKEVMVTPLVSSSDKAWKQSGFFNLDPQFAGNPPNQDQLTTFTMAMMTLGEYQSFFNGKPLPEGVEAGERLEKSPKVRHIFLGDSDFIIYGLQNRRQGGNLNFFLNSIDFLTLGEDLIGIRSKQVTDRPLIPLNETASSIIKFFTILIMPFTVIVIGVLRFLKRRNMRRMYEAMYSKA